MDRNLPSDSTSMFRPARGGANLFRDQRKIDVIDVVDKGSEPESRKESLPRH